MKHNNLVLGNALWLPRTLLLSICKLQV